jgi:hypothetical protein
VTRNRPLSPLTSHSCSTTISLTPYFVPIICRHYTIDNCYKKAGHNRIKYISLKHNKAKDIENNDEVISLNKIVAVENNLAPIKDYLLDQGCQVIDVESAQNTRVDAVVISGSSKDLLGMQDVLIDAPVIDARGKTPSEVWDNIMRY